MKLYPPARGGGRTDGGGGREGKGAPSASEPPRNPAQRSSRARIAQRRSPGPRSFLLTFLAGVPGVVAIVAGDPKDSVLDGGYPVGRRLDIHAEGLGPPVRARQGVAAEAAKEEEEVESAAERWAKAGLGWVSCRGCSVAAVLLGGRCTAAPRRTFSTAWCKERLLCMIAEAAAAAAAPRVASPEPASSSSAPSRLREVFVRLFPVQFHATSGQT